jgi:hypothetical protein
VDTIDFGPSLPIDVDNMAVTLGYNPPANNWFVI